MISIWIVYLDWELEALFCDISGPTRRIDFRRWCWWTVVGLCPVRYLGLCPMKYHRIPSLSPMLFNIHMTLLNPERMGGRFDPKFKVSPILYFLWRNKSIFWCYSWTLAFCSIIRGQLQPRGPFTQFQLVSQLWPFLLATVEHTLVNSRLYNCNVLCVGLPLKVFRNYSWYTVL